MGDFWWTNGAGNNNANDGNNWSATEGGIAIGSVPGVGDTIKFSATSSNAACTFSGDISAFGLYTAAADTGGTDDYTGTITQGTHALTLTGEFKLDNAAATCEFVIGSSAGTGLTCGIYFIGQYGRVNKQADSIIHHNGDFFQYDGAVWAGAKFTGHHIFDSNANFTSLSTQNYLGKMTIKAGANVTLTGAGVHAITVRQCQGTVIEAGGTLDTNGLSCVLGGSTTFDLSGDIVGSGNVQFYVSDGASTAYKGSAYSLTGDIWSRYTLHPTGDWSNIGEYKIGTSAAKFDAGTLKVGGDFVGSGAVAIDCNTNNPNFEFGGNADLTDLTWTKGTGSMTFTATSGTQDLTADAQTLEDIIHNGSGGTLEPQDALATDSFTGTAGTLNVNGQDITTTAGFDLGANYLLTPTGLNGSTITVGGDLTLLGLAGTYKNMKATAKWDLDVTGSATAQFVDVAYSDASGGTEVMASDSTNSGNNINWNFGKIGSDYINYGLEVNAPLTVIVN